MINAYRLQCCGVVELHGLRRFQRPTQAKLLREAWISSEQKKNKYAYILFTDHHECANGQKMQKAILRNKLGPVHEIPRERNTNTNHMVQMWVWVVDKPKLAAFATKQGWYKDLETQRKAWTALLKAHKEPKDSWFYTGPSQSRAGELVRRIDL